MPTTPRGYSRSNKGDSDDVDEEERARVQAEWDAKRDAEKGEANSQERLRRTWRIGALWEEKSHHSQN